ncbi:class I SAM-dependent methyltransferase [Candidatus Saccharibacteria bacterium]|nr:class I SAM-dependent methyltransferase [Candidatus Saccharibacteria bacterium]
MCLACQQIEKLLAPTRIQINGNRSHDIQVHDERLYYRVLLYRSLGFGEAYTDGWWDSERINDLIFRLIKNHVGHRALWPTLALYVSVNLTNKVSFGGYVAEKHGARVTVMTVSKEQVTPDCRKLKHLPVTFVLQDYRQASGSFDHVVSLGMVEHARTSNYTALMKVVDRVMKPAKVLLLHTIGYNLKTSEVDPWIERYTFPGGIIPGRHNLATVVEKMSAIEDRHNFGVGYDTALRAWHHRLESAWSNLEKTYDERLYRMWRYCLLAGADVFRALNVKLWQVVLCRGKSGGYESVS